MSGAFPPGVSLINGQPFASSDEWSVAGQPTAVGTFNFVMRATKVGVPSNTADHAFTWRIAPMQQLRDDGHLAVRVAHAAALDVGEGEQHDWGGGRGSGVGGR